MKKIALTALLITVIFTEEAGAGAVPYSPRAPQRTWAELSCEELETVIADGVAATAELSKFDLRAVPPSEGLLVIKLMNIQERGRHAEKVKLTRTDCN
jgi:hypothetical protein